MCACTLPFHDRFISKKSTKLSKKILPCKTNFVEFGLDTVSRCNFCFLHPDTVPHVFSQCLVLAPIWRILDLGLKQLNIDFCFTTSRQIYDYDLRNSVLKTQENFIIYLNTVTNHKIWKMSMAIQYDGVSFDTKRFFCSLIKTLEGRKRMELSDKMKYCQKVGNLEKLISFLKSYTFVGNGNGIS